MPQKDILDYLYFGYLPNSFFVNEVKKILERKSDTYEYSQSTLIELLDSIFDDYLDQLAPQSNHLVPISGGWDSRAILAFLLERVESHKIETISFGTLGQLDFDIGGEVAKKLGIKHHRLDLSRIPFLWEDVLASVARAPWTYVPDAMFNQKARNFSTEADVIWVGFLGDPLAGSHLSDKPFEKGYNIDAFVKRQRRSKSANLLPENYLPREAICLGDLDSAINYGDLLDLSLRQANCIAPIVLPVAKWSSWNDDLINESGKVVIAPFANLTWIKYWLSAPLTYRVNQSLYLDSLYAKNPDLFAIRSKHYLGCSSSNSLQYFIQVFKFRMIESIQKKAPWLGLRSIAKRNYLDFDEMFRRRQDYQDVLFIAIDLLRRNEITPWIDFDGLVGNHMIRKKDHSDALLTIIGLAANLSVSRQLN